MSDVDSYVDEPLPGIDWEAAGPEAPAEQEVDPNVRTLVIKMQNGDEFEVDVPLDANCTFGPLFPGQNGATPRARQYGEYREPSRLYLRIYQGADAQKKQLAVFGGVESFRDKSMTLRRKVREVEASANTTSDSKGNRHGVERVAVAERWDTED